MVEIEFVGLELDTQIPIFKSCDITKNLFTFVITKGNAFLNGFFRLHGNVFLLHFFSCMPLNSCKIDFNVFVALHTKLLRIANESSQ